MAEIAKPSLATGAKLTPETWADFVERLREGVRGSRVNDHCTADAIFEVKEKRIVTGIDLDYTEKKMAFDSENDSSFFSPEEWWAELDDDQKAAALSEAEKESFESLTESDKWDMVEASGLTVTGYDHKWSHINTHLTHEAAEAFIRRKQHDYEQLTVFVESRCYSWEFKEIINGILDGKIVLSLPEAVEVPKNEG